LIIVHRKQLLEQWVERIQAFLGISKNEIGRIGQGKAKPGKAITVAMTQS
jgi:superfamily II DNA or RNA helicase